MQDVACFGYLDRVAGRSLGVGWEFGSGELVGSQREHYGKGGEKSIRLKRRTSGWLATGDKGGLQLALHDEFRKSMIVPSLANATAWGHQIRGMTCDRSEWPDPT